MSDNPYQDQTDFNTSTQWLADQKAVDVDLDGMAEFADNMVVIKENLDAHTGYLSFLESMPYAAWEPQALPEGVYTMRTMLANYAELQSYLSYLSIGIYNIGMAAQTVADLYAGTDGWSGATLNSVQWAYANPNATTPENLPYWLASGKTFWQAVHEEQAKGEQGGEHTSLPPMWTPGGRTVTNGVVTEVAYGPGNLRMEITTVTIPVAGGGTYVTTTIYDGDKVISRTAEHTVVSVVGNTTTTTVTTTVDGKPSGSVVKQVEVDGTGQVVASSTTKLDGNGATTGRTTISTQDGVQTITEESFSDGEPAGSRTIQIGAQTGGAEGGSLDPGTQYLRDAQQALQDASE